MLTKLTATGIKAKLTATMATLALLNVVFLTIFSYLAMRDAVEHQARFKLQRVGEIQTSKFSDVLNGIDIDLELHADLPLVRDALRSFTRAFATLDDPLRELQDAYINNNPHPLGQKDLLQSANSGTEYDRLHGKYHPVFDALQDAMGYYDVFLFDTDGNLVYSVFKELDYATNMNTGEWRETGLAEAFRLANVADADSPASFVDFAPYAPSADAPAAFVSRPVFDASGRRLGALVYQMPIDALNENMRAVMGEELKVEAFAVGPGDLLITDLPQTSENDILSRKYTGPALENAREGIPGLATFTDAQGREMLAFASRIDFHGADWFVVVQERTSSLFAQVNEARNKKIYVGLTAIGIALLVSMYLARSLSAPLQKVTDAVVSVAAKKYDVTVPGTDRADEIGSIARSLDDFRVELAEAEAGARDAAFKSAAFESTGAPMLLTDLDLKIVGANDAYLRLVNENPVDFEIIGQELTHESLVNIDLADYVFPPEEIRAAVSDHSILPIKRKMPVGDSYVGLLIDLVRSKDGTPLGYVFDMKNQTFQMLSETVLHAIDEQQARVEFDLNAKIKLANARACEAFGLEEADLVGRDGKSLLAGDDAENSGKDFWDAALKGEGTGGRFRLEGQGGKRIIEGNFSPVPDQDGTSKGFLLIGNDVTEARQQIIEAEEERRRNAEELQRVIGDLSTALAQVADGGLSTNIAREFTGEYEKLRIDFNSAVARLGSTIGKVIEVSELIAGESSSINSAVTELSSRTESQAATLEQTTAAMTQLAASVESSSEEAQTAARFAAEARTSAESSGMIVREAADAMSEIEDSSQKVSKIIGVIDDIAFQTNLLALNAGVEAARAGDAGRGFAVVASEVRALAQRCLEASNEITSLITVSGESVTRGVELVGQAASALEGIASGVVRISDNVAHIAEASDEQSKGLGEIRSALVNLDQMTQHNAAMAEETTAAAQSLENVATELRETTSTQFTLSGSAEGHAEKDRMAG